MRQTGWKDDLKAGFVMMREMRVMLNYLISRETTTTTCPRSSACDWCFCPLIMTVTMRGKASVVRGRVSFYFFLFFFIFLYFSLFFFIFLYFSFFFFIFLYFSSSSSSSSPFSSAVIAVQLHAACPASLDKTHSSACGDPMPCRFPLESINALSCHSIFVLQQDVSRVGCLSYSVPRLHRLAHHRGTPCPSSTLELELYRNFFQSASHALAQLARPSGAIGPSFLKASSQFQPDCLTLVVPGLSTLISWWMLNPDRPDD
jgi:hypothetical protein